MKKLILITIVGFALTSSIAACSSSKKAKCDAYSNNTKTNNVNSAK